MLEPNIGLIRVKIFFTETSRLVREALKSLHAQGMDKLILDVRDNRGGFLEEAVFSAASFFADNKIITISQIAGQQTIYRSLNSFPCRCRLIILANSNSANATEIFISALTENRRALLLDSNRTFGKAIICTQLRLFNGTEILLPTGWLLNPSRKSWNRSYKGFTKENFYAEANFRFRPGGIMPDRLSPAEGDALIAEAVKMLLSCRVE